MTPLMLQNLVIVLLVIILALSVWLFVIERRLKKLLSGKDGQSLEGVITSLGNNIRSLEKFRAETNASIDKTEKRLRRSVQGVETIRFNAFKGNGDGGNQSFAIALLSEDGDGTVISSLYARDRMSTFAKPIKKFASEVEMTAEERAVVEQARRS